MKPGVITSSITDTAIERTVIDSVSLVLSEHQNVMDHLVAQQMVNIPSPREPWYLHISVYPCPEISILYFCPVNNEYIPKSKEK